MGFSETWAQLSKNERRKVRREMMAEASQNLSTQYRLCATNSQLKAAAKTLVDRTIAYSRATA